jgi:hypothetical protein
MKHFHMPWGSVVILIIFRVLIRGCTSIKLVFLAVDYAIVVVRLVVVVIFFFREQNVNETSINVYNEAGF